MRIVPLQTVTDLKDVIATNDATVVGILLAVVVALAFAVVFLYKNVQTLNKQFIEELKQTNESLIKVNNSYNEFVNNMLELRSRGRTAK